MGTYDTFVDGGKNCQTKMFNCLLSIWNPGDAVPLKESFTMILPDYEGARYAIVQNGIFVKLTDDTLETTGPYYDKWGGLITDVTEDVGQRNPLKQAVDEWVNSHSSTGSAKND